MGGRYRCLSKYRAMLEKTAIIHVLFFIMPVILCAPLPTYIPEETYVSNTLVSVLACPINEGDRELKALAKCGNTSNYHCLQTDDGKYVEFCNLSSTWVEKGTYALFSKKYTLVFRPCPTGTFQPYGRWSHESSPICDQKMSACIGIGEVVCDNGNVTSDRLCRCDNTNDWVIEQFLQENPLNTTCVLPSQTNFVCVKVKKCPPGQELDPGYNCINKCHEGFYRPSGSFDCLSFALTSREPSDDVTSSNVSPNTRPGDRKNPKIELHPFVGITRFQATMVFPIAIAVVVLFSACSILVAKCKKNSSKEKQLQNLANEKLQERRARKRHRRKIEKRKRRQEKKDKLQVKVDKALHKMEQRQKKRRERKLLLEKERKQAEQIVDAEQVVDEDQISIEM